MDDFCHILCFWRCFCYRFYTMYRSILVELLSMYSYINIYIICSRYIDKCLYIKYCGFTCSCERTNNDVRAFPVLHHIRSSMFVTVCIFIVYYNVNKML